MTTLNEWLEKVTPLEIEGRRVMHCKTEGPEKVRCDAAFVIWVYSPQFDRKRIKEIVQEIKKKENNLFKEK